jgi:hypothetical protein
MDNNEQTITCSKCGELIPLSTALTEKIKHQLESEFSEKNQQQSQALALKLAEIEKKEADIDKAKESVDEKVEAKIKAREKELMAQAENKASANLAVKIKDLENQNTEMAEKITKSQETELELLKEKRALEDKKKELELEVQKKLQEGESAIFLKAKKEVEATMTTKLMETQKQLDMTNKALEEARRKGEQGSMQIQGEVQEEDLKRAIVTSFPVDIVEDVPPGINGADLIQTVRSEFGTKSGKIIWESKITKTWSEEWVKKLKDDRGIVEADECILVTRALPSDIEHFGKKDGVWVADYKYALALASTLRGYLIDMAQVKNSLEGRDEKVEQLYNYISGTQFRHRIENIVTAFESMQTDLNSEKRAMVKIWNKRSKEIDRVILNTSALYGDLQGITTIPNIQQLELSAGEDDDSDTEI